YIPGGTRGIRADRLARGGPDRRRQEARLLEAVHARVVRARGAADVPEPARAPGAQPDPRSRLPVRLRPRTGVHPSVPPPPPPAPAARRRLRDARAPRVRGRD